MNRLYKLQGVIKKTQTTEIVWVIAKSIEEATVAASFADCLVDTGVVQELGEGWK